MQQEEIKFFAQMKKALGMELKTENVFNALENIDEDGDKLISKEVTWLGLHRLLLVIKF